MMGIGIIRGAVRGAVTIAAVVAVGVLSMLAGCDEETVYVTEEGRTMQVCAPADEVGVPDFEQCGLCWDQYKAYEIILAPCPRDGGVR